jgi:hypothetical protein
MFTPIETALGAVLLHLATTTLLFDTGAILGASGLLRRLLQNPKHELANTPTMWFFAGMAAAVGLIALSTPEILPEYPAFDFDALSILRTALAGVLTGWGTKVCNTDFSSFWLQGVTGEFWVNGGSVIRIAVDARLDICSVASAG